MELMRKHDNNHLIMQRSTELTGLHNTFPCLQFDKKHNKYHMDVMAAVM